MSSEEPWFRPSRHTDNSEKLGPYPHQFTIVNKKLTPDFASQSNLATHLMLAVVPAGLNSQLVRHLTPFFFFSLVSAPSPTSPFAQISCPLPDVAHFSCSLCEAATSCSHKQKLAFSPAAFHFSPKRTGHFSLLRMPPKKQTLRPEGSSLTSLRRPLRKKQKALSRRMVAILVFTSVELVMMLRQNKTNLVWAGDA